MAGPVRVWHVLVAAGVAALIAAAVLLVVGRTGLEITTDPAGGPPQIEYVATHRWTAIAWLMAGGIALIGTGVRLRLDRIGKRRAAQAAADYPVPTGAAAYSAQPEPVLELSGPISAAGMGRFILGVAAPQPFSGTVPALYRIAVTADRVHLGYGVAGAAPEGELIVQIIGHVPVHASAVVRATGTPDGPTHRLLGALAAAAPAHTPALTVYRSPNPRQ